MNKIILILVILGILILLCGGLMCLSEAESIQKESFRGRGGYGYRHRRRHRYGPRHHHYGPIWRPGWRNNWVYTVPVVATGYGYDYDYNYYGYNPSWYDYIRSYNPWYYFKGFCKDGCSNLGNGKWGCQYPGNGVNSCVFASDCNGCGN